MTKWRNYNLPGPGDMYHEDQDDAYWEEREADDWYDEEEYPWEDNPADDYIN